jgi:ribosome biogenesis GTPase A
MQRAGRKPTTHVLGVRRQRAGTEVALALGIRPRDEVYLGERLRVIDGLLTLGEGQRISILAGSGVGKSTLINTLKGKKAAKTGDEAGVTKIEQRITLADDFYLYDTPGVLWPRIIVEKSGYNLAASGAIGVNAFDDEEVALELLNYLIEHYPSAITARYKIENVSEHTDETLLEAVARYRGAIQSGGRVNTTKAAEIVIHDFRSAALGRLTLETPDQFAAWLASGLKADADRAAKKEALNKEKKKSRKTKS